MKQLLLHNLGWKIASLMIAIGLWISVAREPELVTTLSAPIEFKNLPEDLDFSGNLPERERLEIRGPSGRLSRDNLADIAVVLDLKDARPGERTYNIRPSSANLPSGVSFDRAVPSQLTLHFERLVARDVPIDAVFVKTPEGYRIQSDSLDPPRVRIRGPEERVLNLARVMTDPMDLSGVVSEREFQTHVNVGDPRVRVDITAAVRVKVRLEKIPRK